MIPNKILVATDGSPSARGAESFAAGLADMMGECQVTVATVLNPRGAYSKGGAIMASTDAEIEEAEDSGRGSRQADHPTPSTTTRSR